MALPVDFMERVVDWPGAEEAPGYINAHWSRPDGKGILGLPFKTLNDFMSFVQYAAGKPERYKEMYFCTSKQRSAGSLVHGKLRAHRDAKMAVNLKCLWLDVDVKPNQPDKNYTTFPEALDAINQFVNACGLPKPSAMIHTGGGIHVYWIAKTPLSVDEWKPYGEGLKKRAHDLAFKCDPISGDAARIMRVPGTFNNKQQANPRPVKLLFLQDSYDFATTPGIMDLPKFAPVTAAVTQQRGDVFELPQEFARGVTPLLAHLSPTDVLGAGLRGQSDLPLEIKGLFANCQHFKESFVTHGKSQSQGLWMLNGLASTWLEDGQKVFHTLSKGYPNYSKDETDDMYARKSAERVKDNLGWPSCQAFEAQGANCKGCPFYGKIRSPLNLAERQAPPAPTVTLAQQVATAELDLPPGYVVVDGLICKIETKHLKDDVEKTEHVPLFRSKLRNFRCETEPRRFVFETSLDAGKYGVVAIKEGEDMVNETTIMKALCAGGVKPNRRQVNNGKEILIFMTSFMERFDEAKQRQKAITFGWLWPVEGGLLPQGFAYAGELVKPDGSRLATGYPSEHLRAGYEPRGLEQPWWDLHNSIMASNRIDHECIAAAAFGAPIQFATKQYNGTFCYYSNGSGAHKSTATALGAAVWGSPQKTKEKATMTSVKGVMKKMGDLHNLPVYWDEIDGIEQMTAVAKMVSAITEGSEGSKLTGGRDYHEINSWQTLIMVGSNVSLAQVLQQQAKQTDAKLERVFEIEVEKRADAGNFWDYDKMVDALNHNFGHMGIKYRNFIATNIQRIESEVQALIRKFFTEVGRLDSKERFRGTMAVAIYAGAMYANEIGCGFHLPELWEYIKAEFIKQRRFISQSHAVGGSAQNVLSVYSNFLNTVNKNILHVTTLNSARGKHDAAVYISGPNKLRQDAVYIRMSVAERIIDISKPKFEEWCQENGLSSHVTIAGLKRHWGATEIVKVGLAVGSGIAGGPRVTAIRIPVDPAGPFAPDLYAPVGPDQLPEDYVPYNAPTTDMDENPVTAPVTETPKTPTGLASAMAQAAADLNTVRKAS